MSKLQKPKGSSTSHSTKFRGKKALAASKKILAAPVTTAAVRFGSLGENTYIYTKDGVDAKFDKIKDALTSLADLGELDELDDMCTMYDIRQRLQTVVTSLVNIANELS